MGMPKARFGSAKVPVELCHLLAGGLDFRHRIPSRSDELGELGDTKLGHPEACFMSYRIGKLVVIFSALV